MSPTKEEEFLSNLGNDSFLRLWSWPNLFRDQGDSSKGGDGKEICDLTVIFGNDILLFSDKKISFQSDIDLNFSWPRWARQAIKESMQQLIGAKRRIQEYPDRVFIDKKCKKRILIKLNDKNEPKFHQIIVCHGIENQPIKFNKEASFTIDNSVTGNQHWTTPEKPFTIGQLHNKDGFIHIFNEATIELVLKEFDTTKDFIEYLYQREKIISLEKHVQIRYESDIVQLLYENYSDDEGGRSVLFAPELKQPSVSLDKGGIINLYRHPQFIQKKNHDAISYFWDSLIDWFSFHALNGSLVVHHEPTEIEPGLRKMASTNRFERRILAETFVDFYNKVQPDMRGTRICPDPTDEKRQYVFFLLPSSPFDPENYREERRQMLLDYCLIYKHLYPTIETIIGIAAESRTSGNTTMNHEFFAQGQDLVYFEPEQWTAEKEKAEKELYDIYVNNGLLKKQSRFVERADEFPTQYRVYDIDIKGRYRNRPCICGSGKKIKKCCGK